jgi:hypothetical protein
MGMAAKFLRSLRLGKLELLLVLAVVSLGLQLFPAGAWTLLWMLDVRNWPRTVWFWVNIAIVAALVAVRLGPGIFSDWKARRERINAERQAARHQKEQREHREMLAGIKEGRRRRRF